MRKRPGQIGRTCGVSKREFWGLDLETSGNSHDYHVPIQLGICAPNGAVFRSDIGGWDFYNADDDTDLRFPSYKDAGKKAWSPAAFEIHKIPLQRLAAAPDRFTVQAQAARFIGEHSEAWIGNRIVVGWNVASFDMVFVREYLPAISNSLSYRSLDLNAASFITAEALGLSWGTLNKRSKEHAQTEAMKTWPEAEPAWHDAGFDAVAALHSLEYMKMVIAHQGYPV